MHPTDAAFFSLFLQDTPLTASHIPRFFALPKKKKGIKKMAISRSVDRHFSGPGWQNSWCKGKGGNIWWRNQEMLPRLDRPI